MSQTDEVTASPTKERSKSIQAIDKEAVHRICSGQVVLNLATAVKELVENSLDAGATSIEIRLREYGSELVEVADNGCGVEESNFQGLTLKHHTSKLREFSDLLGVETFGFRGEALSSLCALSEMTVTTRHISSDSGTKLTYDSRGLIISRTPCARQVGTTVALSNLFSPLPVRQKEFLRNLKREFMKMSQVLHAYCLISTGVKILCSNQTKKGGKSVVVSTQGSSSFKGNIMCIFGAKQANNLLDIELETPSTELLEEIGLSTKCETTKSFLLEGCISSCAHGQGRSSTDRQFYFINNRPCDPSKVSKVVNEVYHQFNLHQNPFVFLNIKTARDSVDINVTPDKRQIFLDNEKLLLATVKSSLLKLYKNIPNSYEVQNVAIGPPKNLSALSLKCVSATSSNLTNTSVSSNRSKISLLLKNFSHSTGQTDQVQQSPASSQDCTNHKGGRGVKRTHPSTNVEQDGRKQLCLSNFILREDNSAVSAASLLTENEDCTKSYCVSENDGTVGNLKVQEIHRQNIGQRLDEIKNAAATIEKVQEERNLNNQNSVCLKSPKKLEAMLLETSDAQKSVDEMCEATQNDCLMNAVECDTINSVHDGPNEPSSELKTGKQSELEPCNLAPNSLSKILTNNEVCPENNHAPSSVLLDAERSKEISRKVVSLPASIEKLRNQLLLKREPDYTDSESTLAGKPRIRFYTEIDPTKNKSAEEELKKEISKDMFSKMEIIGQFNLGFIITKLGHDLFIVDQHATDEKYNFEMLQAQTSLTNQKLVVPQMLELTAVNETILMENLEIFLKNGFDFVIHKDAEPTKRIRLAAKPISHNWEFGKEDIDELLFMLQDSPHTMCRPSRVRAMFASRACRKSVMIGTALSKSSMRQLVNHMGEIEQPWNCPHGRPTMRHLINLELVRKQV